MVPHQTFPGDCGLCHVPESWDVRKDEIPFEHGRETGFALTGAHDEAACLRCHNDRGPVAVYTRRGCGGCHADPHKAAFGVECARCHAETAWEPIGLVAAHAHTRFPLVAVHAITPCESCHVRATAGDFRGTQVECHFCHQEDQRRAFPNHAINGWQRDCERCHTPASWDAPGFNHSAFPLAGGHAGLSCVQCHPNGQVRNAPTDCFACHRQDYIAAPNHVSQGFSTQCTDCHNTNAWN
jgi:hypothetical protein